MGKTAVVIGAGGGIGRALSDELLAHDYRVIGVTRSGRNLVEGIEPYPANQRLSKALAQADIAYWTIGLPYAQWVSLYPLQFNSLVQSLQQESTPIVFADNLYNYGPVNEIITEDTPWEPAGPKERLRADLNREFLDLVGSDLIRGVIGKSSDYIGPYAPNSFAYTTILKPISEGKKPIVLGSPEHPHTFTDVRDTACGLIRLGQNLETREQSGGRPVLNSSGEPLFHLPAAPTGTIAEFIQTAQRVWEESFEQYAPRIARGYRQIPGWQYTLARLASKQVRHTHEIRHQFTRPWQVDHSEFDRAFGPLATTSLEQTLIDTFEWIVSTRND